MSKQQMIVHLRNMDMFGVPSSNGGATFACMKVNDKYYWDVAYCNPKDNFCRKYGNAIATGRLKKYMNYAVESKEAVLKSITDIALEVGDCRPTEFFKQLVEKLD